MIKEKFMKWKIIPLKDWNDSLDLIIKGIKPRLKKSVPEKIVRIRWAERLRSEINQEDIFFNFAF